MSERLVVELDVGNRYSDESDVAAGAGQKHGPVDRSVNADRLDHQVRPRGGFGEIRRLEKL